MTTALTVTLKGSPNPDFGQYATLVPLQRVEVESIEAAQTCCRTFITQHNLGGGNWGPTAGIVRQGRKVLGHVSYNGRWWPTDAKRK